MKEIIEDLGKLGKEIETAKTNVSQLQGRRTEVVNRLKEEFGISTLDEVSKLIDKSENELDTMRSTITSEFDKLKESFSW